MTTDKVTKRKHPLAACETCPMNGIGFKFVPTTIPARGVPIEAIVVGQNPAVDEVIYKKHFVGNGGKLMRGTLQDAGFNPDNVVYTNIVLCRPPDDKIENAPGAEESCRPRLEAELQVLGDRTTPIIAVGKPAAQMVTRMVEGVRAPKSISITKARGQVHQPNGVGTVDKKVHLTVHPAFVLRSPAAMNDFVDDVRHVKKPPPPHKLQTAPRVVMPRNYGELKEELRRIPDGVPVAFDIESSNLTWYDRRHRQADRLLMIGLAWTTDYTLVLNERLIVFEDGVTQLLDEFFKRVEMVAHNGKFDCLFLHQYGMRSARTDYDTMLAHYVLHENPPHGLKEVAFSRYGIEDYEARYIKPYLKGTGEARDYGMVPEPNLAQYLAWDCAVTLQLHYDTKRELTERRLYDWPFKNVLMRGNTMLFGVEKHGIAIDRPYLDRQRVRLESEQDQVLDVMRAIAGRRDFNPRSWKQLGWFLYDFLGIEPINSKHWPNRSTSAPALKAIAGLWDREETQVLRQYRRLDKILGTYVRPILHFADLLDRNHPSYNLHRAVTGRLSANKPPIQTMPRASGDEYGAMLRASYIAPYGRKLVIADYSQAELRVWAHLTQDPYLLDVFARGLDLHGENARRLYGDGYTKEQRTFLKNWVFAYIYGGDEYSFSSQHNLPVEMGAALVREFRGLVPVAEQWREDYFIEVAQRGYSQTCFGRVRQFPLIVADNVREMQRQIWNTEIQSTASDLNLLAGCELSERGHMVVLTMHDATAIECDEKDAPEVALEMERVMVELAEHWVSSVPWKVDVEIVDRWASKPQQLENEADLTIDDVLELEESATVVEREALLAEVA